MKKQTKFQDFTRIFDGSGAQPAPAAQPQFIVVPQPTPVVQQPQMIQVPASVMEDYQRRANEAAEQSKREAIQRAAATLPAPPPGQGTPSADQEAKSQREQIADLVKLVKHEQAARQAAELNGIRSNIIAAYRAQGLSPAFDIYISGTDEAQLRQSAANALNVQAQEAQRTVNTLMQQYAAPVQQQQFAPPMQQMLPQGTIPTGYVQQPAWGQISAPSMISAPAPVQQGVLSMEQLNKLTSHEAMMSGQYGQNRGAIMQAIQQGTFQPSTTQYAAQPAPMQFQPQGTAPMNAFNAPQSRFVPQFQPQQPMMAQQQGADPIAMAIAASERMRQNPGAVQAFANANQQYFQQ